MLIEVVEAADKTSGGLLLTEGSKERPTMGKVVAVGPGRAAADDKEGGGKAVAPKVEVGATVLYQKYSGTEVRGGWTGCAGAARVQAAVGGILQQQMCREGAASCRPRCTLPLAPFAV